MPSNQRDILERLYLLRSQVGKMSRELRVLKQQTARIIEAVETTNDSPPGGHTNDDEREHPA